LKRFLPFAFVFLAAIAVFSPLLRAPFLFDDHTVIESDGAMVAAAVHGTPRDVSLWEDLWRKPRPLRQLTHRLEWRLAGENPVLPHAVNILLHLAVAGAGFLLLRRRCGLDGATAGLAAALFLFNPVVVESVGIVSHRKEMLSALFLLLSLSAALEAPGRFSWTAAGCLLLAAAGKETALVMPALFAALAFRSSRPSATDASPIPDRRLWRPFALYCLAAAAGAAFFWWQIHAGMDFAGGNPGEMEARAGHFTSGVAWAEATGAAIRAFPRNLLLLALPVAHAPDPVFALHVPLFSPGTLVGTLAVLFCLGILWHMFRSGDTALLSPVFWMLATIAPYLCPWLLRLGATAVLADRYLYLPSFGFAWLVAIGLRRLPKPAATAAAAAVLILQAGSSFALCRHYRDEAAYWAFAARENPASTLAAHNHAFALWKEQGDFNAARREFSRMMRLSPDFDYGICSFAQMHAQENDAESALELLDAALARRPQSMHLHRQRALLGLLFDEDDAVTAIHFRKAARLGADDSAFHRGYAELLQRMLDWPGAVREFALAGKDPVFAGDARESRFLLHDLVPEGWNGGLVAGDSVPHGTGTGAGTRDSPLRSLADALNERLAADAAPVADLSVPGSSSFELRFQLEARLHADDAPTLCILLSGHNDAIAGVPSFGILWQLADAALECRRAGIVPVIVGPISVRDDPDMPRARQEKILAALDKKLAAFCKRVGIGFVSARRVLGPNDPSLPSGANYNPDSGNHLSRNGIDAMADSLLPFFPLEARMGAPN
jgi:tetratricopeptide (TPR) repeat protein